MKLAIVQPIVPVYREEFFYELNKHVEYDIYIFKKPDQCGKEHTNVSDITVKYLKNKKVKYFLFYNPLPLLRKDYDAIVLMQSNTHISAWLLLISKWFHKKKIILWGHGISISKYTKEEYTPNYIRSLQIRMSDGIWLYMEKEYNTWSKIFPSIPMIALNNTISKAREISLIDVTSEKETLKKKYSIIQEKIIIFCARFETIHRRTDLLIQVINNLNAKQFGFIIIGEGKYKPDFSIYENVYDFGSIYDTNKKTELFTIADIYFQPGWVGLSIVEAMAYAKPICTFMRSDFILQCVEYSYILNNVNGLIFNNLEDCIEKFNSTSIQDFQKMGNNARELVLQKLTPRNMAMNALSVINNLNK